MKRFFTNTKTVFIKSQFSGNMAIRVSAQSRPTDYLERRRYGVKLPKNFASAKRRRRRLRRSLADSDDNDSATNSSYSSASDDDHIKDTKPELFGGKNDFSVEDILLSDVDGSVRTPEPSRKPPSNRGWCRWWFSSATSNAQPKVAESTHLCEWESSVGMSITDETVRFHSYSHDSSFPLCKLQSVQIKSCEERENCLEMAVEGFDVPYVFHPDDETRALEVKLVLMKAAKAAGNIYDYRSALNQLRDAVVADDYNPVPGEPTGGLETIIEEEEVDDKDVCVEALQTLQSTRIDTEKRNQWASGGVLYLFLKMLDATQFQSNRGLVYGGISAFTSGSRAIRKKFADIGLVQILLEHLRLNVYDEAIQVLAGLSQLPAVATQMGERGAIGLLLRLLPTMSDGARKATFTTLQNMANQPENQALFMYSGGIDHILKCLRHGAVEAPSAATILLLLSENDLLKQTLLDSGVYEVLQNLLRNSSGGYSQGFILDTRLALANLAAYHLNQDGDCANTEKAMDIPTYENAQQLVNACQLTLDGLTVDNNVYQLSSLITGISNLALIEEYKDFLMQAGAGMVCIRTLRRGVEESDRKLIKIAINGLWQLAFLPKNKDLLVNLGCVNLLADVQKRFARFEDILKLVDCVLFTLGREKNTAQQDEGSTCTKTKHSCMISYSWAQQSCAKRLYNDLVAAGHTPWIDIKEMKGSILNSMADAIESVPVVIICASRDYFLSGNCRLEAEYSLQQRKEIIPVLAQADFKPSSWLGMIFGTKLYYTLTPEMYIEQSRLLVQVVTGLSKVSNMSLPLALTEEDAISNHSKVSSWESGQVEEWLDSIGLGQYKPAFIKHAMNGRSLIGVHAAIEKGRDEFVETMLRTDFEMSIGAVMGIKTALHSLLGKSPTH